MSKRLRVGIAGLRPGESWAFNAHLPALRALYSDFEIVGVANSSLASARAAADACDIPRAFASVAEMAMADEIDLVSVTVKVPGHAAIVRAAVQAGKHVYCEWPLGNGLAEAIELAGLAREAGVKAVIGTQMVVAPAFTTLRRLVNEGYVGNVLSATLVGSGLAWGATIDPANAYLLDCANGATMLTIPFGHAMAGVHAALGEVETLSAAIANRRRSAIVSGTDEVLPMTAPDQVMVQGFLEGGAAISVHYRGGTPQGTGFLWEINGTEGDLQLSGPLGHPQMVPLTLKGARSGAELGEIALLRENDDRFPADAVAGNTARLYSQMAADLRDGSSNAPSFADAVALHRLIAAVELAAQSGGRSRPADIVSGLAVNP